MLRATLTMLNRKVLMLGAGFVTRPTLDVLSDAGVKVSVGTNFLPQKNLASK